MANTTMLYVECERCKSHVEVKYIDDKPEVFTEIGSSGTKNCPACGFRIRWNGTQLKRSEA